MAATRDDVARRAGVSTAIVSYVVNNGPRPVAPETRAKVLAAIRELSYTPNAAARSLRRMRTSTIGVLVPQLDVILNDILGGAQDVAARRGFQIVYTSGRHDPGQEREAAQGLIGERVAGAIWIPASDDMAVGGMLALSGIPVVAVDPPRHAEALAAVGIDNYQGGYLATRHLIELGHRRIALVDRAQPIEFSRERVRGYRAALQEAGVAPDPALVVGAGPSAEDGFRAATALLSAPQPPTAIFAYADILAVGVLRAAHTMGVAVPRQLSVVGFDDIALAAYTCPALTTIAAPKLERGQRAAELLFQLIEQGPAERRVELPVRLVRRETTAPPAAT